MFFLIAFTFFILSACGLAVSMLRLKEAVPVDLSNIKLDSIMDMQFSFDWVLKLPHDALLLVAVFLIASVLSLGAVKRASSASRPAGFTRYRTNH